MGFQIVKLIDPTAIVIGGLVPKGVYNSGTTYSVGDSVSYNSSSYVCISASTGNLPTNTIYWQVLANKGDTGATGAKGDPGDPNVGMPTGGTTGQVLSKNSGTDYDTEWSDPGISESLSIAYSIAL